MCIDDISYRIFWRWRIFPSLPINFLTFFANLYIIGPGIRDYISTDIGAKIKMTGIPVSAVLKKYTGLPNTVENHEQLEAPKSGDTICPGEDLASEKDLLKNLEKDFADEAGEIIDRLRLSHLKAR